MTAWRAPATRRASLTATTGRSIALLGMHAQYEHSPPTSSRSTAAQPSRMGPPGDRHPDRPHPDHDNVIDVDSGRPVHGATTSMLSPSGAGYSQWRSNGGR